MSPKPLVLVDGSSYIYRAFHVPNLQRLTNSEGMPTGAVHGVLNMVYRLLADYDPDHIAVIFDAPGKTFRDDLYAQYKANRPPMPDELGIQIEPAVAAIDALGIPILRIPGVEADDVIGTLATEAGRRGLHTIISTTDKDMTQLVTDNVELLNTMDDRRSDVAAVEARYGVAPRQMIDYLALIGDTSDNVPGVPGVGPKTAAKWLNEHGSLEVLVQHAGDIGGKVGDSLRASVPDLPLYKELVTIRCDLDLPAGIDDLARRPPDEEKLREVLEPLEMHAFLRRLGAARPAAAAAALERTYDTVTSDAALEALLAELGAAEIFALDTQATSLSYMDGELVGISFSWQPGRAAYVPLGHRYAGAPEQLPREAVLAKLKPLLEAPDRPKAGHLLKHHAHVLQNHGITLAGMEHDSMLESYVLNSTAVARHDLDSLAPKYLGAHPARLEDVAGKGVKQLGFDDVEIASAAAYAAERADIALRLHGQLWPALRALPELERLYCDLERPLALVLRKMERSGVRVDAAMLVEQSRQLAGSMAAVEQAAYADAGGPFNIGSPKQLQEVLYDRLGLPVLGKTPKGQPSTSEDVLQKLAETFDLPRHVLEYRALSKLKSTYTDKLPREINPRTGRIHTCYHQAVAATGRLSSSDPNLQNIPVRRAEGRLIRQAFVAAPGHRLIAADYSQIELRIMAHLSGDAGLLQAFRDQEDVHRATAAEVFNVPREAVTPDQRRSAKAINFGLIYGMSAFGLARELGIERGEAQAYVDLYFERYPGVRDYMDRTRELARKQGFVATVFGRRLYLPEIAARNVQRRQYAERAAINAPMQGSAADIIKRAMLEVDRWLEAGEVDGRLIMQVHDELVLEVAVDEAEQAARQVAAIMCDAARLDVPLRVDTGIGDNWDQAH